MESSFGRAQGTPEEIKQGEEQLTKPEARSSTKREEIFSALSPEQQKMLTESNLQYSKMGGSQKMQGKIRGENVSIDYNSQGEATNATLNGQEMSLEDANAILNKWHDIAIYHNRFKETNFDQSTHVESKKERLTAETVGKLLA